jgi:hypothetical protein
MTTRTRYFVIASLLVLGVGMGSGLVAYYSSYPMSALARRGGPDELKYVPHDVSVLAYADIQDVMHSQLRQKLHDAMPVSENGQREFQDETGINIETDIEHVVAFAQPGHTSGPGGMVLARGTFDVPRIESLMTQHGATSEVYKGVRVISVDGRHVMALHNGMMNGMPNAMPRDTRPDQPMRGDESFSVSFIEPRVVAVGATSLVHAAIDQKDGPNVTSNDEMMKLVRSLDSGNAWAVGRFDTIQKEAHLPAGVASQIPPITWFSITSHVNGGIRGTIRAETRDPQAAGNLRDVVGGFVALAKMQSGSNAELQTLTRALEVNVAGNTVELSFAVPAEAFDALGALGGMNHKKPAGQKPDGPAGQ